MRVTSPSNTFQKLREAIRGLKLVPALGLTLTAAVMVVSPLAQANPANTLPTGEKVVTGSADVSRAGNTMNIQQNSKRVVVNWDSFNVGANAKVNIQQPSSDSAILNRVTGRGASQIDGQVSANGQVIFVNPNGVVFGKGADVNAAAVVATTMDTKNEAFMAGGKQSFEGKNSTAKIVNQGKISTTDPKGFIALLAPEVRNEGYLVARVGSGNTIAMASGEKITLDFKGNQLVSVKVDVSSYRSLIENKRAVEVDGGMVIIAANAANNLMASVVNNTGVIRASSMVNNGGVIELTGGTVTQAGGISANGRGGESTASSDSSVQVSGAAPKNQPQVSQSTPVSKASKGAQGGRITITGDDVILAAGSKTEATGTAGGGVINVGTTKVSFVTNANGTRSQPKPEGLAKTVSIAPTAFVDASATVNGDGGDINIWSSVKTSVAGVLKATGGVLGGQGGFIETSSKLVLDILQGIVVDVSAPKGKAGYWLLDPEDMVIDATTAQAISTALQTSDVTVEVTGNLTIASGANITQSSGSTTSLTLIATGSITNNATISGSLNVSLHSDTVNLNQGSSIAVNQVTAVAQGLNVDGSITTNNGGTISLAGNTVAINGTVSTSTGGAPASTGSTGSTSTTSSTTTANRENESSTTSSTSSTSTSSTDNSTGPIQSNTGSATPVSSANNNGSNSGTLMA